jgi:lysophospholipase L1-like esterase
MLRLLKKLALSLGSLVLLILLLEVVIRVSGAASFERLHPTVEEARKGLGEILLEPDAELLYRLRRGVRVREPESDAVTYVTSELGHRVAGEAAPDPGGETFRVVCLGDSCTFGVRVPFAAIYSSRLEQLLREAGVAARVANLGVPGYCTAQGLRLIPQVADLRPQVVTVAYGFNDSLLTERPAESELAAVEGAHLMTSVRRALARSHLAQWLRHTISHRHAVWDAEGTSVKTVTRVSSAGYEENQRALLRAIRALGAQPVLIDLDIPNGFCRAALARVAHDEDVPLITARQLFDEDAGKVFGFAPDESVPPGRARVILAQSKAPPYVMGLPSDRIALRPFVLPFGRSPSGAFALEFGCPETAFEITAFAQEGKLAAAARFANAEMIGGGFFVPVPQRGETTPGVSLTLPSLPIDPYRPYLVDVGHMNERGHDLMARAILRALQQRGWVANR